MKFYYNLNNFIDELYNNHLKLFPYKKDVLNFIRFLNKDNIKAVIIGQDVYPYEVNNVPVSNGIAFFTNIKNEYPKSFKELFKKYDIKRIDKTGLFYEQQGLCFMNVGLTVVPNKPLSLTDLWIPYIKNIWKIFYYKYNVKVFVTFGYIARRNLEAFIKENNINDIVHLSYIHPANRYAKKLEREKLYNWIEDLKKYIDYNLYI